jgi:DNA-directed RNA polymerase subunit H
MSFEQIDALYRSRVTILKLLTQQGYNTVPFERFSPREIELMATEKGALDFIAETEGAEDERRFCRVMYASPRFNKTKMDEFISELELEKEQLERTEFIVMLVDDIVDAHHASALQHWFKDKIRVRYFNIYRMTYNPLEWEGAGYTIKYEIVGQEKHADLLKALHCNSKSQLPLIQYHKDPSARCLGLVPGDIVKITRSSANVGEAPYYRVCAP